MFSDHVQSIIKYPCEILTCDPKTKTVQGLMRTGPIHISVYTTDPLFRWPRTGENWIIRQENGSWYLDSILQDSADKVLITDLQPGDIHINAPGLIRINDGTTIPRKYKQVIGDGTHTKFTISHGLNTFGIVPVVISTVAPNAPITSFSWAPVVLPGGAGDPNNLIVTIGSVLPPKGAEAIVIG